MKKILTAVAAGTLIAASQSMGQTTNAEPVKAATSWADKVTVKGDVRFRYESIDAEGKDLRQRERVRARVGLFAKPDSDVDVGVQFSTTEKGDPVSSNQTLGGGNTRKSAYLDLMFVDYHPELLTGLHLIGGKMEQPFIKVSDLIWDNDLNPEGAVVKYKTGEAVEFLFNGGAFSIEEREAADETMMYGAQAALKFNTENASYVQAGVGLFSYDNIEGQALLFDPAKSKGNSTDKVVVGETTNLVYANAFQTPEFFAEAFFNGDTPVSIYGNYVVNNEADSEDTGYLAGIRIGKAKVPGSWELDYNWRHLEANAAVGAFADSDSFGGGTDGEGHRISGSYQLTKSLKTSVTYFMNEAKISKDQSEDYDRLQVDVAAKF